MPEICYTERNFRQVTLDVIDTARSICEEYAAQGFDLTLRQLYYQMVSRDFIPNNDKEYDKLGSIVNDARLAGLLDWDYIVDRGRNVRQNSHWDDAADGINSIANQFQIDKWAGQDNRVEVWVEKEALIGVIEHVCGPLDVPFFACKGYVSQSEMWGAAQRLLRISHGGYRPHIIHLGDHDPSGIDMSRDIQDRLHLFMRPFLRHEYGAEDEGVMVHRIALNIEQVHEYDPPPNPAKMSDSRAPDYVANFGEYSWELDALNPATLAGIITEAVTALRNKREWDYRCSQEAAMIAGLQGAAERWEDIERFLRDE